MKIAVIIPTYNEAGAIAPLLEEVFVVCKDAPLHEWHIVVVDANSPDGTGDLVRAVAERHLGRLHLIVEPVKRGIAAAYILGMRYAIDELAADVFIEFDGDGQHDPRDIPRLVEALEGGATTTLSARGMCRAVLCRGSGRSIARS